MDPRADIYSIEERGESQSYSKNSPLKMYQMEESKKTANHCELASQIQITPLKSDSSENVHSTEIQKVKQLKLSDASIHASPPCPADFTAHQLLGTGSFGEVYLVEENSTKQLYAMKVLSKDKIHSQNLLKYAFAERAIMVKMTKVNHPYIVKIKYAF